MSFQSFPSEAELLSFFEVEPEIFADLVMTYTRVHQGETLYCSFTPEHGDVDLTLLRGEQQKAEFHFSYGQRVELHRRPDGRQYLRVTFPPAMRLRDFILTLQPEVTFLWGTELDKGSD